MYFVDRRVTDHFKRDRNVARNARIFHSTPNPFFPIEKVIRKHCVFVTDKVDARTRDGKHSTDTTRQGAGKKRRGSIGRLWNARSGGRCRLAPYYVIAFASAVLDLLRAPEIRVFRRVSVKDNCARARARIIKIEMRDIT